jgi:hypothetical protein
MSTVPGFVPEIRDKARIAGAEGGGTSVHLYENTVPRSLLMMPGGGIEPPWNCCRRILSFRRLPYVYENKG